MLRKISDSLFKSISKNFGWKLFSIICAVVLWFIVMNIINPTEIQTYSVNITFLNEDKLTEKGLVVMNKEEIENTKIDIKVKSTRTALDELNKNKKEIKASVDLKQFVMLYAKDMKEPFKVAVTPTIPTSYVYTYELVNFTPGEISIKLDNIVEVEKDIIIDSEGEVSSGYLAGEPHANPSKVNVKGASSQIDAIESVKVLIDMSDASEAVAQQLVPVAYDKDGNEIKSLIIEPETVEVSFGVYKYGQIPVEKPDIEGTPAKDYQISGVDWEPKYIQVVGDEEEIARVGSIKPKVKIDGREEEQVEINYDVNAHIAKNKLSIREGTKKEVTVTVNLEKEEEREFIVKGDNITASGQSGGFKVILPSEIKFVLKGIKENLDSIKENDITASVDVSGLTRGKYSREFSLTLPENVSLNGNVVAEVEIAEDDSLEENPENLDKPEENPDGEQNEQNSEEKVD